MEIGISSKIRQDGKLEKVSVILPLLYRIEKRRLEWGKTYGMQYIVRGN